ncbi:MAG: glycosyltransferase [Duncaniella sp.]|nr:glycosyltransferase [Duncaniella sp.]
MTRPDVSVIIPVYNAAKYIEKCIDSILSQPVENIEVVAVNDASSDDSAEILARLSAADSRIKVINKPQNEGSMMARHTGYKVAQGRYFAFVDADDYLPAGSLRHLLDKAAEVKADIVIGDFILEGSDGRTQRLHRHGKFDSSADSYMRYILNGGGNSSMCGAVFDRRLFDDFDYPEIKHMCFSDDRVVMTTMMVNAQPKMASIDEVTYSYFVNYESMTRSRLDEKREREVLESLYFCYNLLNGMTDKFRKENDAFLSRYLSLHIEKGNRVTDIAGFNDNISDLMKFSNFRKNLGLRLAVHTQLCKIVPYYGKLCSAARVRIRHLLGR